MEQTALAKVTENNSAIVESVVINGDLSKMTPTERVKYYQAVCNSLGLNPLTKPFDYINLNGKLTLYARRECTEQLRDKKNVSVRIISRERMDGVYIVTAHAETPSGRTDESIGVVNIDKLAGDALANALMKAETKAKRRVTLSICGLGWMDESETDTIRGASRVSVAEDGEIVEAEVTPPPPSMTIPPTTAAQPAPEPKAQPANGKQQAATAQMPEPPEEPPSEFSATPPANGNQQPVTVNGKMTLETAEAMISNSPATKGKRYGDLTSEELSAHSIGLNKALHKEGATIEQKETAQMKLDAIAVILASRAAQNA